MTIPTEKPRCPDARRPRYSELDICTLNSKHCILELGEECRYYNEWLEEENKGNNEPREQVK